MVSEVSEGLDPYIPVDRLALQDEGLSLADLEDFLRVLLLDVEGE